MKSGNPALKQDTFAGLEIIGERMTLSGTVNKAAILLALVLITAMWTWGDFLRLEIPLQ